MFYMLTNVHHQITAREVPLPPHHIWYVLPDLPYDIQNVAVSL
jgi:hypothetical protein